MGHDNLINGEYSEQHDKIHVRDLNFSDDQFLKKIASLVESVFQASTSSLLFFVPSARVVISVGAPVAPSLSDLFFGTVFFDNGIIEIQDTLKDRRLRTHPDILNDPIIRFFYAYPIMTSDDSLLGAICLFDQHSRSIRQDEKNIMSAVAQVVAAYIESRTISNKS